MRLLPTMTMATIVAFTLLLLGTTVFDDLPNKLQLPSTQTTITDTRIQDIENRLLRIEQLIDNSHQLLVPPPKNHTQTNTPPPPPPHPAFCRLSDFSRGTFHPTTRMFQPSCELEFKYTSNCFKRINYAVMMGDSQTYHLALAIRRGLINVIHPTLLEESSRQSPGQPITCRTFKSGAKCGEEKTYFNFVPSPILQAKCKSCNGCTSFVDGCNSGGNNNEHQLEYLAVEQLYDMEMPSATFNTTQENVLEYLSRPRADGSPSPVPDLFIINAGAHMQTSQTLEKVKSYFRPRLIMMIHEIRRLFPGTVLVWVSTNKIEINSEIGDYMYEAAKKTTEQNGVPFLDAMNISSQLSHLYSDHVHLHHQKDIYYNTLRDLIFSWYCSSTSKGFRV